MHDEHDATGPRQLGRRNLLKLGTGAVMTTLAAPHLAAQGQNTPPPGSPRPADAPRPFTGEGYQNTYNRLHENGPMDDTTRQIADYVLSFNESQLNDSVVAAMNRAMVDSIASVVAGFEGESVRVAARLAKHVQPTTLKSTVFGYGITTSPELAAFANGVMIRRVDFNDNAPGGHNSDLIPAALAIGEALHSSGTEVMTAVAIGYELKAAPAGGESVAAAMTAAKLMKLDQDRLANAIGMALVPHVALNKGVGAMSMWKGARSAEATKCGVWAALLAREGMTGPPQPFEGRGSLWAERGRGRPLVLPVQKALSIERSWNKRWPSDAQSQGFLELVPKIREWTTADDIASIQYDMTSDNWQEVGGNAKWDPRNHDTADHSAPFLLSRAIIDGDIYLDSFVPEKYPHRDPKVKALMSKITMGPVPGWGGLGTASITIKKRNGETKTFDTWGGVRNPQLKDYNPMTFDEVVAKYKRVCDFMKVDSSQRDRALAVWSNLKAVKDIGEAMRVLATFGRPQRL